MSEIGSIPTVAEVRRRIDRVKDEEFKLCLQLTYLAAARISEIVGYASPHDTTTARGPRGEDCSHLVYDHYGSPVEAVIFRLKTAKRGGRPKLIALPLSPRYEPWTEGLKYFQEQGKEYVFPFNRQKAWMQAKESFEGLKYPIEMYRIFENGEMVKEVKTHQRDFRLHALRHVRTTELIEFYGFDGFDLSLFGGWKIQSAIMGAGAMFDRYSHLQWRKYFPKLLVESKT